MGFKRIGVKLSILLIVGSCTYSCKKGDNDPVFSLRTRKARISNNWKVSFSEIMKGDTVYTFDGVSELVLLGDVELAEIPSVRSYTFDREGTYTIEISNTYPPEYLDSLASGSTVNLLETGTWSFTGGTGEIKNKEQLLLLPNRWERRTEGFAEVEVKTWDGQTQGRVYNIDMLKAHEMRWVYDQNTNTPEGVFSESGTLEFQ